MAAAVAIDDIPYPDLIQTYSLSELLDVARHIDREKYPGRYALVMAEIEQRGRHPLPEEELAKRKLRLHQEMYPGQAGSESAHSCPRLGLAATVAGLSFVLGCAAPVAILGGILWGFAKAYFPVSILPGLFGICTGLAAAVGAERSRIEARGFSAAAAGALSLFAFYVSWIVWVVLMGGHELIAPWPSALTDAVKATADAHMHDSLTAKRLSGTLFCEALGVVSAAWLGTARGKTDSGPPARDPESNGPETERPES